MPRCGSQCAGSIHTRDQAPAAIVLVYVAVAVAIAVSVKVYRRATSGVSGPSIRQQQVEGVAILISFLGSPVIQGAMKLYGASDAIVYGVIPAAGPLIIVGTTVLGIAASKADRRQFGAVLAVVTAGVVALFVRRSGAWLVAGIGLFIGVVGYTIATALRTHLRKLEDAGYLKSETTGNGRASRTSIALTRHGRAALDTYTDALRHLLSRL